jgi:hypothetical protein
MKNKTMLIGVLVLLVFAVSAASAENRIYLVPEDGSVPSGYCNNITIELRLNTSDLAASWEADIAFNQTCVDMVDVDFTGSTFDEMTDWAHKGTYIKAGADVPSGTTTSGDLFLANLIIHCNCSECAYCESPIEFTYAGLYDDMGEDVSVVGVDGKVTCGTSTPPPCLGDCYEDLNCTYLVSTNVTCYDCIGKIGQSWENYPCLVGTSGCTCPSMCWTECPECCDGVDNDGDGPADWPADPKCGCCIDGNETDGSDPCPPPCVPELPTLALAGIGILGIALLARKRD